MSVLNLIGVGPGDPELLTLKATRLIAAAAVVAYPHKPGEASLAFDIAKSHVSPRAVRLPVDIPMSVEPGPAQAVYDAIAETLAAHVTAGRSVAWLCEGDPLFYGSAIYLLDRLAGRIPIGIVPGVTSLTAAAAAAARPLATRSQVLKVLPAPLPDETLEAELASGAAAIVKLGRHFDRIRALLTRLGRAEAAVIVEHATQSRERVTPLLAFAATKRPYFSVLLVPAPDPAP